MDDATNAADDFDDYFEDEDELARVERERFAGLIPKAKEVIDSHGLEYEIITDGDGDSEFVVSFPAGRDKRTVSIDDAAKLERFLELDLQGISFLNGIDAVCFPRTNIVEAGLQPVGPLSILSLPRLMLPHKEDGQIDFSSSLSLGGPTGIPDVHVGVQSNTFKFLVGSIPARRLTLRISTNGLGSHAQIEDRLTKISNALFFQIDLLFNIPLSLSKDKSPSKRSSSFKRKKIDFSEIAYPTHEYDAAPSSLYWYGRSANAMPLLRFLSFYQVVEFFYPVYARAEVNRRVRLVMKDPSFRVDREADISKVVSAVSLNRSGGFLDERSQLRAVINECLSSSDIKEFIESSEEKIAFYKADYKKIHPHKIPVADAKADLRNDVAERLYGIRCKIVHTKAEGMGEIEILLPYSREEQLLFHDIELMQFVARSALVASGTPLHL